MIKIITKAIITLLLLTVTCYAWSGEITQNTEMWKSLDDITEIKEPLCYLIKFEKVEVEIQDSNFFFITHGSGLKGWVSKSSIKELSSNNEELYRKHYSERVISMKKRRNLMAEISCRSHAKKERPQEKASISRLYHKNFVEIDTTNNFGKEEIEKTLNTQFIKALNDTYLKKTPIVMTNVFGSENIISFDIAANREIIKMRILGDITYRHRNELLRRLHNLEFTNLLSGEYSVKFYIDYVQAQ